MIKIRIIGGLGNQLFQYATAFSLARKLKTNMRVDLSVAVNYQQQQPLRLTKLNCSAFFCEKSSFVDKILLHPRLINILPNFFQMYYIEKSQKFDQNLLKIGNNKLLIGYFQNELYFRDCRKDLLKEFLPTKKFNDYQRSLAKKIQETNSVSVHIRRGDYIANNKAKSFHGICKKEYFDRAINYLLAEGCINEKTNLFIFSDDIEWCKQNLGFTYSTVFVDADADYPELDMWLMSYCKHHIISNSTFSWWGAWLNENPEKIVVAPKKWYANGTETDIQVKTWILK